MRHIGTLPTQAEATKFADFLLTEDIRINADADGDEWAIWVFDEDKVPQAKEELEAFRENPSAEKYAAASSKAAALREKEIREHKAAKKRVVRSTDRWNQSFLQRCPVTVTLIALSCAAVVATTYPDNPLDFGDKIEPGRTWLSFSPIWESNGNVYTPIHKYSALLHGEVWRLFTPMFLHFHIFHLLFNMLWLKDLGGVIETRRGKWKFFGLVLLISGISNLGQGIMSGPNFGGMSGVVFGLFGYIWMQARYVPNSGFFMPPNLVVLMLLWLVICFTGAFGPIANTAHTLGLLTGMIAGYAPKIWRDMTR